MSEEQRQNLSSFLKNQKVSDEDRRFWLSRLETAPADLVDKIIAFFEAFPGQLGWLRSIQERKEKALAEKDDKLWKEIVKEEEGRFTTLLSA